MADDVYTPSTWADGPGGNTAITAAKLAKIEAGVDAQDNLTQSHEARLDSLEALAGVGGNAGASAAFGTTAERPPPSAGKLYFDTTLNKLLVGQGTFWKDYAGTTITGTGGSNAPTGLIATAFADNTIKLDWTPPATATAQTIREDRSPSGVSGMPLSGTATTSTRGPLATMGNYRYWVTATVGGVESAISNYAYATLPVTGGTPTGTFPAAFLNINGLGSGQGGNWNLGVGYSTGHVDKSWTALKTYEEVPYFHMNATNDAVLLRVYMNGGKTSPTGTSYPRVELRELEPDGVTKKTFKANTGTHILSGTHRAVHFAPNKQEVCIAQMHDAKDDRWQIRIEGTNIVVKCNARGDTNLVDSTVQTGVTVGTFFDWKCEMINGTAKFYINGVLKLTHSSAFSGDSTDDQYFKTGDYAQQNMDNGNAASEYCEIEMKNLICSHTGE